MCLSPSAFDLVHACVGDGPLFRATLAHFSVQGQILALVAMQLVRRSDSPLRLVKLACVIVPAVMNLSVVVGWWLGWGKAVRGWRMAHVSILLCNLCAIAI